MGAPSDNNLPITGSGSFRFASINTISWLMVLLLASVFVVPMPFDALLGLPLVAAVCMLSEGRSVRRSLLGDHVFWLGVVLVLYIACSTFWSTAANARGIGQVWLRASGNIAFFVALSLVLNQRAGFASVLNRIVVAGAAIGIVAALLLYVMEPPADGRLEGLFRLANPGRAGRTWCVVLPFSLTLILRERGAWRGFGVLASALLLVAILLSGTRSAWIAVVICLLAYGVALAQPQWRRFSLWFGAGLALCFAAAWLVLQDPSSQAALLPRGDSYRLGIWAATATDLFASKPWYGWGQLSEHWTWVGDQNFRGAHNLYLSVMWQGGLAGLLLLFAMVAAVALRLVGQLRRIEARIGLTLLLMGCTVFFFSGDRLIDKVNIIYFVFWAPLGIALALRLQDNSHLKTP